LNNLFLTSFAQVVQQKEAMQNNSPLELDSILKNLDILIVILDKAKLKKNNQLVLMTGIKIFLNDF